MLPRVSPGDVRRALPDAGARTRRTVRRHLRGFRARPRPGTDALEPSRASSATSRSPPARQACSRNSSPPRSTSRRCCGARRRPPPSSKRSSLGWLRQLLGLPDAFEGVIYDTASISTLHALAAAREAAVPGVRDHGLAGAARGRTQSASTARSTRIRRSTRPSSCSDSDITPLRHIPADDDFRMRADALRDAIAEDRAAGIERHRRRRDHRHDVDDERRSRCRDRRHLPP